MNFQYPYFRLSSKCLKNDIDLLLMKQLIHKEINESSIQSRTLADHLYHIDPINNILKISI